MIDIREAHHRDAAVLAGLVSRAFQDVARRFGLTPETAPTHPSNCTAEWIAAAFDKGVCYFILEQDGRACGCAAIEPAGQDTCYLKRLAVLPAFRNNGFGAALVRHAVFEARKRMAKQVEIAIIANQMELKEWYEKLGFTETRTARFDHLPFAVLFMKQIL